MVSEKRTMREIWERVRDYLKLMVTADVFDLYIRPLQPAGWAGGTLTLAAPTERVRSWCALRFNRMIEREVTLEAGRPVQVVYVVGAVRDAD